jgi:putative membrane protein
VADDDGDGDGDEIDPRFTFANERTFLAWNRTALALVAAGAAAAAFIDTDARLIVALPLIALGAVISLMSYRRWEQNERAMRRGEPLRYDALPRVLGLTIGTLALLIGVLAVIDALAK